MNHIKSRGIQIRNKSVIISIITHNNVGVSLKVVAIQIILRISIINPIILNRIPTVATLFFWFSSVILKNSKIKNLLIDILVLIEEKSSKNSD